MLEEDLRARWGSGNAWIPSATERGELRASGASRASDLADQSAGRDRTRRTIVALSNRCTAKSAGRSILQSGCRWPRSCWCCTLRRWADVL